MFYDKVLRGFVMRFGDCSGNDIWFIYGFVFLMGCVRCCKVNFLCVVFMFYDGCECYFKIRICWMIDIVNFKNFFYDKIVFLKV